MKQQMNIFESEDKNPSLEIKNSALTKEELAYIARLFGERQGTSEIRRAFRKTFYPKNPRKVHAKAFNQSLGEI